MFAGLHRKVCLVSCASLQHYQRLQLLCSYGLQSPPNVGPDLCPQICSTRIYYSHACFADMV